MPQCLNAAVRKIDTNGIITTVAGTGVNGFAGDGGAATSAQLGCPSGAAVDAAGNIYIADFGNNRIRKVDPNGIITTIAGNGQGGFSGDDGPAVSAELNIPNDVDVNTAGSRLYRGPRKQSPPQNRRHGRHHHCGRRPEQCRQRRNQ